MSKAVDHFEDGKSEHVWVVIKLSIQSEHSLNQTVSVALKLLLDLMRGLVLVRIANCVCNATNSLTNFFNWLTFSVWVHVHELLVEDNVTLLVFAHVSLVSIPSGNLFCHLGNDFRAWLQVRLSSSLQDSLW